MKRRESGLLCGSLAGSFGALLVVVRFVVLLVALLAVRAASPASAGTHPDVAELGVIGHSAPPRGAAIVPVARRVEALAPIPAGGVHVDLWSDPPAGALVRPGTKARIRFRANVDCYVTVISVDTEGRVRLLFPAPFEDGRVRGGRTYRLPAGRGSQDLVFTGPPGQEYVYALASIHPVHHRYPHWLVDGRVWNIDPWDDDEFEYDDVYLTGFVIGDPHYRIRVFCRDLVVYPEWPDSYATAYLYFNVARRVSYPRYVCSDCHYTRPYDPYGHTCAAVQIRFGEIRTSGYIDFRVVFVPVYRYEISPKWRPRGWRGSDWRGPDGRWVWSSADGRDRIRKNFVDAAPPRQPDRSGDRSRDPSDDRGGRNAWQRAHEERLESSVRGRDRVPERDSEKAGKNRAAPRQASEEQKPKAARAEKKAPEKSEERGERSRDRVR